jgi:hypothetical protein
MDIYYFQVPDTGYRPGSAFTDVDPTDTVYVRSRDGEFRSGMGAAPEPYVSGSGGYKVIRHQPGNAR